MYLCLKDGPTMIFSNPLVMTLVLIQVTASHQGGPTRPHPPANQSRLEGQGRRKRRDLRGRVEKKRSLRLDVNQWVPWTVGLSAGVLWLGLELVKRREGPRRCRLCNGPAKGPPKLWGPDAAFRAALRVRHATVADRISSILAFGVLPAWSAGTLLLIRWDPWRRRLEDLSLLYEAVAISSLLQQITSLAVARRRPEATFHQVAGNNGFENTSFFSGHTTLAFTLAASAVSLLHMRGNRWTWLVALVGFSAATAVGLLRVAADKHFMSDVVVGAAVGTATGFLVPKLSLRW